MIHPAVRLEQAVKASVPITGLLAFDLATHEALVDPPELQSAAQPIIDTFDWSDIAHAAWEESLNPERKSLRETAAQAVAEIDNYLLLLADNATGPQVRTQVKLLSQIVKRVIKRLVQI